MRPHQCSAPSASLLVRSLAALALAAGTLACGTLGAGGGSVPPRATLEFDNQSPDPVRVYLVIEDGGQYLLGRVYPMQRNSLTIPRHLPPSDAHRVALVAVPIGSPDLVHPVASGDASRQIVASLAELSLQRFVITPTSMHGVLGGRVPALR